jgi:plastocyanin
MNTKHSHTLLATVASTVLAMVASATGAADWGTLQGRLVVEGSVPEPTVITPNKDVEYCGQHQIVDETLVPGENGGLPNAFVYLYTKRGQTVAIHPDLESADETVVLDNKGCRFEPHVLLVRTGQAFEIHNDDPGIGHNTNAQLLANPTFNETVSNDVPIKKTFEKSEPYPANVSCNVHPWMKSHLLIRDNPYMVITGEDGSFEIANIPAGQHEFIFWHESTGNLKNVSLGSAGKTDRRGRAKLKIPAGDTLDLGDVKIPPKNVGL